MIRVTKKPEERRREIVLASRDLFLNKGYEKTTMQDVMQALNIAKGTTYYYFKSKEELLEAVIEEMVSAHMTAIEQACSECRGDALTKMRVLAAAGRVDQEEMLNQLHRPDNTLLHLRLLALTLSKLAPLYASLIEQGCKEGIFHTEHPLECAEVLLAGIQFVTDTGIYPWKKQDLERRAGALPGLMAGLLQAPKEAFNFLINERLKNAK
jgi:AcrR family transcriptional regulator